MLNYEEVSRIVKEFVQMLANTFPWEKINENEVITKMFECKMELANFSESLGTANYFYKNRTIYYRNKNNIGVLDDYMVHELIHYFQDLRDKNGNLNQMGLCYFLEFKIYGMAMNEAAIQYVTSKMLRHKEEDVEYCQIKTKTISSEYYPLLCNLIMQMVYLLGEKPLVESVLFSTDRFIFALMDIVGENVAKEMQMEFDTLLEAKQILFSMDEGHERKEQEYKIKALYEKIQNQIFTSYFDAMVSRIETIEEAEEYKDKLEGYKDIMGNVDNFSFYLNYKEKQLEKLNKKIIAINRKNSKNMLAVVNNNKVFAVFKVILNLFRKREEDRS